MHVEKFGKTKSLENLNNQKNLQKTNFSYNKLKIWRKNQAHHYKGNFKKYKGKLIFCLFSIYLIDNDPLRGVLGYILWVQPLLLTPILMYDIYDI